MKIKIEFEVNLPDVKHSQGELEEYLRYHFRDNGSMSCSNPFEVASDSEPEPIFGTFDWGYDDIDESLVVEFN